MYPNCFLVRSSAKRGSPMSERRIVIKAALRAVVFSICEDRKKRVCGCECECECEHFCHVKVERGDCEGSMR